ncbi:MAG: UDP-N-acetylglucosamine 2-epimerase (non-hydrolyzing) [Nanoarchaeota archaeon]|nr:UDP-N-acetylglucosamine 2-epimerase (non-hydrolyzing) [Nanoarchaeota archaeon]
MKICFILGTRPEIIKLAPLIKECEKEQISYNIIHTGQHYDYLLDKIFFKELGLNPETENLKIGSGTHTESIGKIIQKLGKKLRTLKPDIILVEGDTNTVLAGAITAKKIFDINPKIKVGHIEAGLRSNYYEMPEEYNRIMTDHISDYLFAPTKQAVKNLKKENIPKDRIFLTGNTIVDAVYQNIKTAETKSRILTTLNIKKDNYILLTAHRQENVDNPKKLLGLIEGLKRLSKNHNLPIIYPIHPRTKKRIRDFHLFSRLQQIQNLIITEPVGYFDFLILQKNAALIITDSGGVQEESCILKVPCITIRDNTERPETIKIKSNILVGCNPKKMEKGAKKMLFKKRKWKNPFGDGKASQKIINILKEKNEV